MTVQGSAPPSLLGAGTNSVGGSPSPARLRGSPTPSSPPEPPFPSSLLGSREGALSQIANFTDIHLPSSLQLWVDGDESMEAKNWVLWAIDQEIERRALDKPFIMPVDYTLEDIEKAKKLVTKLKK